MRRTTALLAAFATMAIPAMAQRGGARGGHAVSSGSFSAHSFAPHYTGSMPASRPSFGRPNFSRPLARTSYYGPDRRRNPRLYRGYGGVPYLAPAWNNWSDPGYLSYPDTLASDDSGPQPYGDPNTGQPQSAQQPYPTPNPYPYPPQPTRPQATPAPNSPVTLVFKDGRPSEQIHNYMMNRTTLFVRDQHPEEIPLSDLDLAATEKISDADGADFEPPK